MRMRTSLAPIMAAAAIGLTPMWSAGAQAADPQGLVPIAPLERVLRDNEDAWRAGDGPRLAALFREDGFALHNDALPVRGRAAIARTGTAPGGDIQLRAFAYAQGDSVGYVVGAFSYPGWTGPGGKFLLALRRGPSGRWLIAADMDNAAAARR